jgi:hypothetical protein
MKLFLLALAVEIITAGWFFYRIKDDTNDGDLILGLLFWAMCAFYILADGAWGAILIWKAVHP